MKSALMQATVPLNTNDDVCVYSIAIGSLTSACFERKAWQENRGTESGSLFQALLLVFVFISIKTQVRVVGPIPIKHSCFSINR